MREKYFVAIVLLLASSFSQGGAITDYSLDEDANIVTNSVTGLQWLQWDETIGQSIDWFNNNPGAQSLRDAGWSVATNTQMAGLFNDFSFGGVVWDTNENTFQDAIGSRLSTSDVLTFISLFGDTSFGPSTGPVTTFGRSRAHFGLDADGDGLINEVRVNNLVSGGSGVFVQIEADDELVTRSRSDIGLALTRRVQVPEPSVLALLSLGLLGLRWRRVARRIPSWQ